METLKRIVIAAFVVVAPAVVAQTYLVPGGDCGAVTLQVGRGPDFPSVTQTVTADRVADAYVYLPHRSAAKLTEGSQALAFDANVPETGVAMAAADLKPEVRGNETRSEHAKTFLFCGDRAPLADWQMSTGIGLEIFPQEWNGGRPRLKAGDPMRFIVVDQSADKLLKDVPVELYRAGGSRIADGVPSKSGGVTFPYQKPGWYMVMATYRRPDPQAAGHWLVDTSTLTFEIK